MRRAISTAKVVGAAVLLVGVAGCPSQEPRTVETDAAYWTPRAAAEKGAFVVTDSVEVKDTEANALQELEESARHKAVELSLHDLVRDDAKLASREDELRARYLEQFQRYVDSAQCVQRTRFGGEKASRLGAKFRVLVKRDDLAKDLQSEGIFRKEQGSLRVIVVLRKPADAAADAADLAKGYLDDLSEGLSRELVERGFRPKLWKDVRLSVAERRDALDENLSRFLRTYVEESDWRKVEDERYELPLILLRSEGRILVGYRILELEKKELAYHCLVRADAYDLFNGTSLGYETETGRAVIGEKNATLAEARQAAVSETVKKAATKLCSRLQDFLDQERRSRGRASAYELTFEGWSEAELARIESLLAGIVAEDVDSKNDGQRLVVTARIPRDPIPVRDEVARSLKALGLPSRTPRRDGTKISFAKQP